MGSSAPLILTIRRRSAGPLEGSRGDDPRRSDGSVRHFHTDEALASRSHNRTGDQNRTHNDSLGHIGNDNIIFGMGESTYIYSVDDRTRRQQGLLRAPEILVHSTARG